MTIVQATQTSLTIPQAPKKEERIRLAIEEVYFLPQKMVHLVDPDPEAICIGIRNGDMRATRYHPEQKIVRYIAEGVPYEIENPTEQYEFKHPPLNQRLANDRVYIRKQFSLAVLDVLMKNPTAKKLYVNCSLGETRSYAVACAVAYHLGFDPKPFGEHVRDENAYTNNDLQGYLDMIMYRHFKEGHK